MNPLLRNPFRLLFTVKCIRCNNRILRKRAVKNSDGKWECVNGCSQEVQFTEKTFTKIVHGKMGSYEVTAVYYPTTKVNEPKLEVSIFDMEGNKLHKKIFWPNQSGRFFSLKKVFEQTVKEYEQKQITGRFDFKLDEFAHWDGKVK